MGRGGGGGGGSDTGIRRYNFPLFLVDPVDMPVVSHHCISQNG